MYNTIEEIKADPMLRNIDRLLFNTDLHGGFIEYEKDKGFVDSGIYFVASVNPLSELNLENKNPAHIQRNIEGNPSTFYPCEFAIKITDGDPLILFDKISEYCRTAEMINVYFGLEGVKVPQEMPIEDVVNMRQAVMNTRNNKTVSYISEAVSDSLSKGIKAYAKETKKNDFAENLKSKFKSREQQIVDFVREFKQVNYETINEKYVDEFEDFLKRRDPNLEYVISDKITVKTGLEEVKDGEYDPYGTAARDHEYREVYFKRTDEHIFRDAFNSIRFSRANGKGNDIPLAELAQYGPVCSVKIPANYMWLVDQCLSKWNVKFAIDYGYLNKADERTVPVLYLEKDRKIIEGMTKDICQRYAGESYVHTYDKQKYYEQKKKQETKKKWFGRGDER